MEVTGSLITRINPVIDQLTAGRASRRWSAAAPSCATATDVASLPTSILQATVLPVLLTTLSRDVALPARVLRDVAPRAGRRRRVARGGGGRR